LWKEEGQSTFVGCGNGNLDSDSISPWLKSKTPLLLQSIYTWAERRISFGPLSPVFPVPWYCITRTHAHTHTHTHIYMSVQRKISYETWGEPACTLVRRRSAWLYMRTNCISFIYRLYIVYMGVLRRGVVVRPSRAS
jgi:hypothetical protein